MEDLILRKSLKYVLLPAKPPLGSPAAQMHNQAFEFWVKLWEKTFADIGAGERPNVDDFLRQDLISMILHHDRVAALHLYTFFDFRQKSSRAHSYFANSFTPTAMAAMDNRGVNSVMTLEYFSVSPEWRGSNQGISLAATLVELGFRVFERSAADMILGICRIDYGVAKLCRDFGGVALDNNVVLHGVPCDLMGIAQGAQRPYRDPRVNHLAAHLWKHREDFTQASPSKHAVPVKKAA